ncbi:MAG TPA: phage tail tube protein [Phycisphaerae bacterium]|nr:phage tail tube protein [Phycisphaerae bacterium]
MTKLGRRKVIKVGIEDEKGQAVSAPAIDLLCYEPSINPTDNTIQREPAGEFGGQAKAERGPSVGTCTVRTELRSDGQSALDAGLLVLFQGCGMKLADGVLSPVTAVADQKTVTIDVYEDGLKKRLYGAMGTWELSGESGKQVFVEFTFTGIFMSEADASLPATAHTAAAPMRAAAVTLDIGGHTPKVSRFTINPNNPVEAREDATAAEGIAHYIVGAGRRYVIGMDPEAEPTATWDINALWAGKDEKNFSLTLSDGIVDVTIAAPKLQQTAPQEALREGKLIHTMSAQCNADEGDDELTISVA